MSPHRQRMPLQRAVRMSLHTRLKPIYTFPSFPVRTTVTHPNMKWTLSLFYTTYLPFCSIHVTPPAANSVPPWRISRSSRRPPYHLQHPPPQLAVGSTGRGNLFPAHLSLTHRQLHGSTGLKRRSFPPPWSVRYPPLSTSHSTRPRCLRIPQPYAPTCI